MSDEPQAGPEPMVINPDEPGGAVQLAPTAESSWPSRVEVWFETHVYTSPYHSAGRSSDPFLAGFAEAVSHIRAAILKNPPPTPSA